MRTEGPAAHTAHCQRHAQDAIELGSIEYAVEHLAALVVMGHEKCGAVTAACSGEKRPTANLQAIVDKIDPAVAQARTYATAEGLLDAAIRENVHHSVRDVLANSDCPAPHP